MPVSIRQIAEVAIVVSDLERSVRFYHEVLGLPIWERQANHANAGLPAGRHRQTPAIKVIPVAQTAKRRKNERAKPNRLAATVLLLSLIHI